MPTCDTNVTMCEAHGEYINDDGVLLNQTTQNIWQLLYTLNKSSSDNTTSMRLYVRKEEPMKEFKFINNNDILGRIEIYDAASFGFHDVTYEATFNFNIGSSIPPIKLPCVYDERTDRLTVDSKEAPDHEWVDFSMIQLMDVSFYPA